MTSPDTATAGTGAPDKADIAARTKATFALLRQLRRAHLRERASSAAFTAYAALIGLAVYGGLLLPWLRRLSAGNAHTTAGAPFAAAAPPALIGLVLLAYLAVLRDALWRGPVTLPAPAASWLLPMPIDRGRLLRPRLRGQLVIAAFAGAVLGAAVAVVLSTGGMTGAGFGPLLGACAGSFAAAGLLAVGTAALVARYRGGDRLVRRLGPVAALCAVGLAVQAGLAAYGHGSGVLLRVELWSGPWGWTVQPALVAAGRSMPGMPGAVGVLAVAAVVAAAVAVRACAGMPGRSLRARARSVTGFSAGLVALNPRAAALEVRAARSRPVRALRLPVPRRAGLIIAWRDATALLRVPSRLGWAVLLTAAGGLLVTLSAGTGSLFGSLALAAAGLAAGYLAVAQLAEPARLDADDPARAGHLPYPFDRLAARHAVVPLVLGGLLAEVCAAAVAVGTGSVVALLLPVVTVPALVAAAMVSAYRGPVPAAAMAGTDTPLGNMGMVQVAAWYAAGPLVAVVLLLPPVHVVAGGHAAGTTLVNYLLWGLAVAAVLAYWARRRAIGRAATLHP